MTPDIDYSIRSELKETHVVVEGVYLWHSSFLSSTERAAVTAEMDTWWSSDDPNVYLGRITRLLGIIAGEREARVLLDGIGDDVAVARYVLELWLGLHES